MNLEARNVTFYYQGRKHAPVLEDFSISISSGERVGLKAPSGRGKTTLCRLLAGYERPADRFFWMESRSGNTRESVRCRWSGSTRRPW